MPDGALEGTKVIELGHTVSAPYCARLFADYGADVIKIEPPEGDIARRWGPFPNDAPDPEKSGLFFYLNTNKRGVTLDVGTSQGREQFLELLRDADMLIENNAPQQMRDWGLDYASLSTANPDLVMVSITPFGQTGPYSDWRAYDLNAYHLSGCGHRYCGRPGEAPLEHGTFSAEFFGAIAGAAWGLAATYGRENAGGGQQIDVSCAEVIAATFIGAQNIGGYAQDGVFERRTGVGMPLGAPATILPCKDGHVWMLALEARQWNALAEVMGNPDWMKLEQFQDMFIRAQNADAMYPLIQQWTTQHTKQEIMDRLQAAGCPSTAIYTVGEASELPHLRERGYIVDVEHPLLGNLRDFGAPFGLPESPGGPTRAAPQLGQHNDEILNRGSEATPSSGVGPTISRARAPRKEKLGANTAPLAGIRVANFGWVWAGPVVGQTLGFLGADVLKIESRARIDINRTLPPFAGGVNDPDRSLQNHAGWAGNGSVTLNLKKPEAKELAKELVAQCDVVVENFGPGAMNALGLGYEVLREVKPDIVMLSMPAAGLEGPLKDVRTYGMSLTSLTGLDSITGYPGGPPIPVENAFTDPYNGILGAYAILVALTYRDRTGKGQHIDYSQQEAMMQMVGPAFMDYVMNGRSAGLMGNKHPLAAAAPHGVFPCAGDDRWISIAVVTQEEWDGLRTAMDHPEWATAREFAEPRARVQHVDELHDRIAAWTAGFDDYELAQRLQQHGVAAAPVLNVADLLNDPHYKARGTFIEVQHPLGFEETIYGSYVKMSRTEVDVQPGPAIGRDNDRTFKELLGLDEARYRELIEQEVIY